MRKLLGTAAMAGMLLASGVAMAATATGTIKSIDTAKHMIVLDNGKSYEATAGLDLSKLKTGEKVTVTYSVSAGKNVASAVK